MPESDYQRGYEAAYAEIHGAIVSREHPQICGGKCRACQTMRAFVEDLLLKDLVSILHPDLVPNHETLWLEPITPP